MNYHTVFEAVGYVSSAATALGAALQLFSRTKSVGAVIADVGVNITGLLQKLGVIGAP